MSRVLIDTQALIWASERPHRLSPDAARVVDDRRTIRLASVASVWEMAIKLSLKKLELEVRSLDEFVVQLGRYEIEMLPITVDDALYVAELPQDRHKDPFDRLIAAQCLRLDLTLVSADAAFDAYGVRRVW